MCSCLITYYKPYRIGLVLVLASLLSAWTCSAIFDFDNCIDAVPQPHVTSLSPETIRANATPVLLIVNGTGFIPRSEILWNGNPLQTTFMNSSNLQATITQQTFESFGGSAGGSVPISVMSPASSVLVHCSNGGVSGIVFLDIE